MRKSHLLILLFLFITNVLFSQATNPPGLSLIQNDHLKKDLYELADSKFRGRSAGTLDELNASVWLAEKFRALGVKPAGDNGTYFQFFNLWRNIISEHSKVEINNTPLELWKEVMVAQMAGANINGPINYLGNGADIDTNTVIVRDKIVAVVANAKDINLNVSLPTWRYNRYILTKYGMPLIRKGATAIIFIADETAEKAWDDASENYKRGSYDIDGGPNENVTGKIPVLWVRSTWKNELSGNQAKINANLIIEKYAYPSVNIIGKVAGTDDVLRSEYVLLSGHTDAHGIRNAIKNDSVYHGADDNASVDVAILANAAAFVKYPGKRSVLFVIHGAEERGLLGSRYYSSHTTVPVHKIVAVLNGDMIGRNNTDSAALLGFRPPHRNSLELVNMAIEANKEGPKFKLDTTWDSPAHIEGWYFRSDHLPYARLGIPSIMYSSLLHADYHTPQDNAENINYPKLKKMTEWLYRTAWKVANTKNRPGTDADFKLER